MCSRIQCVGSNQVGKRNLEATCVNPCFDVGTSNVMGRAALELGQKKKTDGGVHWASFFFFTKAGLPFPGGGDAIGHPSWVTPKSHPSSIPGAVGQRGQSALGHSQARLAPKP